MFDRSLNMPLDKGSKQDTKEILNVSAKPNKKL